MLPERSEDLHKLCLLTRVDRAVRMMSCRTGQRLRRREGDVMPHRTVPCGWCHARVRMESSIISHRAPDST